mmetsp:Transcript_34652/g.25802  ORF Transcript_34652/g.25802 Transcript_34652/m.25802 type:complete len:160 (-) Transcript_34652:775-1254(-)
MKWKDDDLVFHSNILEIQSGIESVIVGTIFKEMKLKPCILENLLGVLGTKKFKSGMYVGEDDYCVLEDSSGRIRIRNGEVFHSSYFVTGSVVALRGISDSNGYFTVFDYTYAGIPFTYDNIPANTAGKSLSSQMMDKLNLQSDEKEYVAFISGLEFGAP